MTSDTAAKLLSERLANSKLTILSGVGHAMMQEAPIDVATWVETFLEPA